MPRMYDHLHFEKLDEIERVIRDHCADITHITVHEVADRNAYPQLGKVCFGAVDLGAFVEPDDVEDDDPSEDDDESEEDGDDDTEDEPPGDLGDLAKMDGGVTYRRLADAAICWIKHLASQNMIGEKEGKFKVNLWRGKGDKVIYSSRFVATNLEWEEPAPIVVAPPAIPVTFSEHAPDPRTWRALGEGYTHLIGLLQTSYQHLAALQNAHISNQSGQLVRAQRSIEGVVGELTKLKIGIYEVETLQRAEGGGGASPVGGELAKEFVSQLGSLGRLLASTKFGMPAEMVELADIVGGSPELQDALKNPAVLKVLRDEKTRKELAALLKLAAQADAAPANDPTPPEAAAEAA
jgi:hypothetical protein